MKNKIYTFLVHEEVEDDFAVIEISEGKFKGFKYHYEKVKIDEIDDTAVLRFNYNVLNDPGAFLENEETRIELEQQIGDILVNIIEEFAEKQEVASRTSDTEKSDR